MITVLVPCAGHGRRFAEAGYNKPKPLIDVAGKPMLQRVLENLRPTAKHRFVVVSRLPDDQVLPLLPNPDDVHVALTHDTEGAVDTILQAEKYVSDGPLLIGNCDQLVDFDVNSFIASASGLAGSLVTFKSNQAHHSYVTTNGNIITSIIEKRVISTEAVTGVYYFRHGTDFIDHAHQVIDRNDRFNAEFYVSSVIAGMIKSGRWFTTYEAPSAMLGTPHELQLFEAAIMVGKTI